MSLIKAWRWARVLSKYGKLNRWQAFKLVRAYMAWAYFSMALYTAEARKVSNE